MQITFGQDGATLDPALLIGLASLALSIVTTFIAVQVSSIARNIRTLDWYRSQNDAWNAYNAQKLGDRVQEFATIDALVTGQRARSPAEMQVFNGDTLSDPLLKAVLYQRLNILERDFKALSLNLVDGANGHYLLNEVRACGRNARFVITFMAVGGYDPDFVMFYRRAARWFAENRNADMPRAVARRMIRSIICDRRLERTNDHLSLLPGEGM